MPQKKLDLTYFKLLETFGEREFTLDDLKKSGIFGYDEKSLSVILNRLRKEGLISVKKSEKDMRVSIYKLLKPHEVLKSSGRGEIINLLKRAADIVRGKVDYEVLLILLFYKAYSDIWKEEFKEAIEELKSEGFEEKEAKEEAKLPEYHTIQIPEEYLWENVIKTRERLTEKIRDALIKIAEQNPDIKDALDRFLRYLDDLIGKENSDLIIRQVVDIFNNLRFSKLEADYLGDAYEWLISYFAPQKAKAGELFTPREVVKLLVEILEPSKERRKILDPAAGSGGMLIYAYKFVKERLGENTAKELILVGQEAKDINFAIMKLNFLLHGIGFGKNVKLYKEDSLLNPRFREDDSFDIVIFNPPWNQKGYGEKSLKKSVIADVFSRFGYPPDDKADWAWIELALHFTKENGKVGIVIDNGCLFRGGKEKSIRSKIIDNDLIEAVILLPEKLFYNTGAPGAIIIFNKKKQEERKGKILFINATEYYEKHPEIKKMNILSEKGIKKIVEVYKEWKEIKGFSKIVSLKEIKNNDYNLNVTLYVYPQIEEEEINLKQVWDELEEIDKELFEIENKIKDWVEKAVSVGGGKSG